MSLIWVCTCIRPYMYMHILEKFGWHTCEKNGIVFMPSLNSYKEIPIEGIEWTQEQGFKLEGISDTSVWDTVKEGRVLIGCESSSIIIHPWYQQIRLGSSQGVHLGTTPLSQSGEWLMPWGTVLDRVLCWATCWTKPAITLSLFWWKFLGDRNGDYHMPALWPRSGGTTRPCWLLCYCAD